MRFKPKHKYGAVRSEIDGIKFPSQLEKNCYLLLKNLQDSKKIVFFLRQVPFDLPGGFRHFVDYCIFTKDTVIFLEAKGRDLAQGKLKRKQVEDIYNIPVHVVKDPNAIHTLI